MESPLQHIIIGQITRETVLPLIGPPAVDFAGGAPLYAAGAMALWRAAAGLAGRIPADFPFEQLEGFRKFGFNLDGIKKVEENVDLRCFTAWKTPKRADHDNPLNYFSKIDYPFPKSLLGYTPPPAGIDSRINPGPLTLRPSDLPGSYLEARAAYIAPADFLTHSLIPDALRKGHITTILLRAGERYMVPAFFDDLTGILHGVTIFACGENSLRGLFSGRSYELAEMIDHLFRQGIELALIFQDDFSVLLVDGPGKRSWRVPPYPARIADPSGYADAVCGGFLVEYTRSYDPLRAALVGLAGASIKLEGTRPLYPAYALPGLAEARLSIISEGVTEF